MLTELLVDAKDRKYQVWERNPLGTEIYNSKTMIEKLDYINKIVGEEHQQWLSTRIVPPNGMASFPLPFHITIVK